MRWILIFLVTCSVGYAAERSKLEVNVVKVKEPPVIDGKLDDQCWREAAFYGSKATGVVDSNCNDLQEFQKVFFVTYDAEHLYIAAINYMPTGEGIVCRSTDVEFSFKDELVQMFIEPDLDGRYVHFGVNWKGYKSSDIIEAATQFHKTRWIVEIKIPWKKLGTVPEVGKVLGFNLCGNNMSSSKQWCSWSPTFGVFHNYKRFGRLILGDVIKPGTAGHTAENKLGMKVVKVDEAPTLDGKLDDRCWLDAAFYGSKDTGMVDVDGKVLQKFQKVFFVAYDADGLYVAAINYMPTTKEIETRSTKEKFSRKDELVQMLIEPNLDGKHVDLAVNCKGDKSSDDIETATQIHETCWVVEAKIPWEKLGAEPELGKVLGFNLCGNNVTSSKQWCSWSPTFGALRDPKHFGKLILGDSLDLRRPPRTVAEDDF